MTAYRRAATRLQDGLGRIGLNALGLAWAPPLKWLSRDRGRRVGSPERLVKIVEDVLDVFDSDA